jgi:hypothetical protein
MTRETDEESICHEVVRRNLGERLREIRGEQAAVGRRPIVVAGVLRPLLEQPVGGARRGVMRRNGGMRGRCG